MVRVADSISIDASAQRVFQYLDEPENHATITPALSDVRNVEPLDNGGKQLEYTYRMAGVPIQGQLTQTVHEPPSRHTFVLESGITGELSFEIEPDGEGSMVTYSAEYSIPGRIISQVIEPVARRYNERELQATLENLKREVEAE